MSTFVSLLRNAILSKQNIKLSPELSEVSDISKCEKLVINNDQEFDLSSRSGLIDNDSTKEEYDIRTVYFSWINRDTSTSDYISKCESCQIPVISFMKRTNLVNYLSGESDTCINLIGDDSASISESTNTQKEGGNDTIGNDDAKKTDDKVDSQSDKQSSTSKDIKSKSDKNIKDKERERSKHHHHNSSSNNSNNKRGHESSQNVEKIDYKEIKRQKLENDPLLKLVSIHEIELIDHDKALRGTQKSNDFSNLIRECEYKIVRPLKQSIKNGGSSGVTSTVKKPSSSLPSSSSSKGVLKSSASTKSSSSKKSSNALNTDSSQSLATILHKRDPIIILSPSATSMINMSNVKSFLETGKFIDSHNSNNELNMIRIIRHSKKFNKDIKFVVVNNVEKFFVKPEYWDRVVAVFTTGQEWQFKNYKINQPNLLFQKVKGFYVNFNGDNIPSNVKNWNVEVVSLDRNQRFKDRQITEHMWESIERFMLSRGYK